jgi:hypothetical protein
MKNNDTTLIMIAVIMTATFMVAALVWQQQRAQAEIKSESSSTSCVDNHPCHISVSNSTAPSSLSSKSNHNKIRSSITCVNDHPCHTSALNSTESLSHNYPPIDNELSDLTGGTTN